MPRLDRGIQGRPERLLVALDCPVKPGNDKKGISVDMLQPMGCHGRYPISTASSTGRVAMLIRVPTTTAPATSCTGPP